LLSSHFSIIVAVDKNLGIGKNNQLPWHFSKDLQYFVRITKTTQNPQAKNAVIMGRNTWASIPEKYRPFPGRLNVVLTRDTDFNVPDGVVVAPSLDDAIAQAKALGAENCFVVGGASVYRMAINHPACERLYITEILSIFDCDTSFPEIPLDRFKRVKESEIYKEKGTQFRFVEYEKIKT